MIPVVLYASKSSSDEKGSTTDQLEQIRIALPPDREEIAAFREENVSGYHGSRGPELQAAMAKAIEAAGNDAENKDFAAVLWVFHSSRLARGSGKKAEARSLIKVYADLLAEGVHLRSVTDDEFLTNPPWWASPRCRAGRSRRIRLLMPDVVHGSARKPESPSVRHCRATASNERSWPAR